MVEEHGWRLHAFVLMSNHEHLLVETPEANLSRGMKLLNGAYTQYFNKRHRRSGHLFQGRYKAHVVEEQGYWSVLSRQKRYRNWLSGPRASEPVAGKEGEKGGVNAGDGGRRRQPPV